MSDTAMAAGLKKASPSRQERTIPRVIAVDGSAASGKSTVGRWLAAKLGYTFLDTGIMYRAITWAALSRGIDPTDAIALSDLAADVDIDVHLAPPGSDDGTAILVDGEDVTPFLRVPEVEEAVSLVSRVEGVRAALVRCQREIAASRHIVMAGRDIGTVVLPDADLKIYLDASLEERAARRYREFAGMDREITQEMVLEDIRRRDRIDSERPVSPLRKADDAVCIDTDGLSLDEVVQRALDLVDGS